MEISITIPDLLNWDVVEVITQGEATEQEIDQHLEQDHVVVIIPISPMPSISGIWILRALSKPSAPALSSSSPLLRGPLSTRRRFPSLIGGSVMRSNSLMIFWEG